MGHDDGIWEEGEEEEQDDPDKAGSTSSRTASSPEADQVSANPHLTQQPARRGAPQVDVAGFPTIAKLAAYKLTMLENVVCASGHEDHENVSRWILHVEEKGTKLEDLATPDSGFDTLDRKVAAALTPPLPGS